MKYFPFIYLRLSPATSPSWRLHIWGIPALAEEGLPFEWGWSPWRSRSGPAGRWVGGSVPGPMEHPCLSPRRRRLPCACRRSLFVTSSCHSSASPSHLHPILQSLKLANEPIPPLAAKLIFFKSLFYKTQRESWLFHLVVFFSNTEMSNM